MLRLSEFDYTLPAHRIAQTPLPDRDCSRLLVLDKASSEITHRHFYDLPNYLFPGDVLVLNDTRVNAQRLFGAREGYPGESVETFLTHRIADGLWQGLVRPGKKLQPGVVIEYSADLWAEVLERTDERGGRLLRLSSRSGMNIEDAIVAHGNVPLPPYIETPLTLDQSERYQTVYAQSPGSAAAPTAGLHFTERLLARIAEKGVRIARVTLHVGIGTFRPIETEDVAAHKMHSERVQVSEDAAQVINSAPGRIIAVGTTSARTLESAAVADRRIAPIDTDTDIYIMPGYRFKIVDALITNFHMPRSSLLLLVSALAGQPAIREAYQIALAENYRFLSFGDAMFIH